MFRVIAVLTCLVLCAAPIQATQISARAHVDSTNYLIGDWITVHVDISHPRGMTFQSLPADTLGGFHILQQSPLGRTSDTSSSTALIVARYDSGLAILPPLTFLYTLPGDSTGRTVATNPVLVTVRTVKVDTTQDIRDVKPPLSVPWTLAEIALMLGIVLGVAAVVYLLYRYWKKRQQRRPGTGADVPPPRPAHVIALEELAILKERKLWQQGLIKQYYSEVTEIIRRYFENRYGFMALEQTTDEIMDALRKRVHAAPIREEAETALRRADLVKFAKHQPTVPEHEEMMVIAYDIVEKTRVVETRPEEKHAAMEAADVAS